MKNCVSCAQEINAEKLICGYCGARQPEVTLETQVVSAAETSPEKQREPKKSRKGLLIGLSALVAVAAVVVLAFVLLSPKGLEAKDVKSTLVAQPGEGLWSGDSVNLLGTVTLTKVQSDEYRVVLEQFNGASQSWEPVNTQSGVGPAFVANTKAVLKDGANRFRISIYRKTDTKPITTSEIVEVPTKVALLPTKCPIDQINEQVTEGGLQVFGQTVENGLDCTYGYPNTDGAPIRFIYKKVTDEEWQNARHAAGDRDFSLGIGESGAFVVRVEDPDPQYSYDRYVVLFHGIMIDSDMDPSFIKIAIEAIPTK
jgi:hypothetical protein